MRLSVLSIGRWKAGPYRELFDLYAGRLDNGPLGPLALTELEEKRQLPPVELKAREAELLTAAIGKGAKVVALDEGGRALDSAGFAKMLGDWRDSGCREVAFLIGGAAGLAPSLKSQADRIVSLGPMTWPHLLVRGMLAEQLYRAASILAGHPYHRG
jgi:23S rRNA (pseudouridine1915-N3)-methyltransferase